jgi:hypothetical protein
MALPIAAKAAASGPGWADVPCAGGASGPGRIGGALGGQPVEEGRDPAQQADGRIGVRLVGQFELELLGHREQVGRVDLAPAQRRAVPCAAAKASISVPRLAGLSVTASPPDRPCWCPRNWG